MQPFDRIQTADSFLNRIQDRLKSVINAIVSKPIVDGVLLEDVVLAATVNKVPHKLDRVPSGWVIVKRTPGVGLPSVYDSTAPDNRFLTLSSAAAHTVSIWVF